MYLAGTFIRECFLFPYVRFLIGFVRSAYVSAGLIIAFRSRIRTFTDIDVFVKDTPLFPRYIFLFGAFSTCQGGGISHVYHSPSTP